MPRARQASQSAVSTRDFAIEAAQLLADRKCEDIRVLNLQNLSQVCDYMIVASGTSDRQMKSIAGEVADLAEQRGMSVFRRNADAGTTWVVLDCIDAVLHLFEPNLRAYYDLEGLWSDAEQLDWRRDDQKQRHRFEGEIGLHDDDEDDDEFSDFD